MFKAFLQSVFTVCLLTAAYLSFAENYPTLELPVRVHLIQSENEALDVDLTEIQMEELFAQANNFWEQAGIKWKIESIVDLPSSAEQAFSQAMQANSELKPQQKISLMNRVCDYEKPLEPGWNLCVVGQFPNRAGGAFFTGPNRTPSVVWPIKDKANQLNSATLAHELGHSLGLMHASEIQENLMTGGGNNIRGYRREGANWLKKLKITEEEITTARDNAEKGQAVKKLPRLAEQD